MRFKVANYSRLEIRLDTLHIYTQTVTTESDEEGILPPGSPPLSPLNPKAHRSPSELVPNFLAQSYAPVILHRTLDILMDGNSIF